MAGDQGIAPCALVAQGQGAQRLLQHSADEVGFAGIYMEVTSARWARAKNGALECIHAGKRAC
eukprot:scaffold280793_cov19-Tisochrysis_lutea.AAC.1